MPLWRLTFQNPWIVAVDAARRPGRAWVVLGLGALTCAAAVFLGRMAGGRLAEMISPWAGSAWAPSLGEAVFSLCIFLPLWLVALLGGGIEGRSVWLKEKSAAVALLAGLAIGALGCGLATALAAALGAITPGDAGQGVLAGGLVLGGLIIAVQAGGEEVFFRGWVQPVLSARFGPWVGVAVTALMFMGLHLVGGERSPMALLNLLLGGLLFGIVALRTGGLWVAFGAHWAWNWTEAGGLGLSPNPGVAPGGALVDLDLVGPALWGGGADGLNGSLAMTLVLAVLVGGAMAATPRRGT